jgi:type II restriction/modification system DNA methylase subunit YeeA
MITNNIKKYAPQARREFIEAVGKRLNQFGVYTDSKGKTLTISEPIVSGSVMQIDGNSFAAGLAQARKRLTSRAEKLGFDQLVEHVAYTWFNRLCAIRFMELKGDYLEHGLRVLSHPEKANSFEILDHAQDVADQLGLDRNYIVELKLGGNKDEELYRHLLLGQCHKLHEAMPFLFEALDDETELLLPDNLTRTDSILRGLVDSIPEEDWQQVEIIGWLYQFYISEKKDQVIGSVVKSEDIPAATQLFTPNWIVKYLVQNSIGRQWLMTNPDSGLKAQMAYYIKPAEQEASVTADLAAITPASIEPESIKVIDPACGSGHILVEAYEVLKAIYEERGYRRRDIPKLILENNLFGLDIDDRAVQLAGFALMMKAREDDRRIFSRDIKLNVLALQSTQNLNLPELWRKLALNKDAKSGMTESIFDNAQTNLVDALDSANFTSLQRVLVLFEQAKTFGSLIQVPVDQAEFLHDIKNQLQTLAEQGDSFQKPAAAVLLPFIHQAWLLAQRYDAVVANPPYMGLRYFCKDLKQFTESFYPTSKYDFFSMFIEQSINISKQCGVSSLVTMLGWLYLSTFESLRRETLDKCVIEGVYEIGTGAFSSVAASVAVSVIRKCSIDGYKGFIKSDITKIEIQRNYKEFLSLPNAMFALSATENDINNFSCLDRLDKHADARQGLSTSNDDLFVRYWFEVDLKKISVFNGSKWYPFNKGGGVRKWYGNNLFVINWEHDGREVTKLAASLYGSASRTIKNVGYYFKHGITWGRVSGNEPSFRYFPDGYIFSDIGCGLFPLDENETLNILGYVNSSYAKKCLKLQSQNVKIETGHVKNLPYNPSVDSIKSVNEVIEIYKSDWNSNEISYDFSTNIVTPIKNGENIKYSFQKFLKQQVDLIESALELENQIDSNISLAYSQTADTKVKTTLFAEEVIEFPEPIFCKKIISLAIGCIMGRYSLNREGLVYAHSGNYGFAELVAEGVYNTFPADNDGIIPLNDQEWFKDDATNRFREFVRTVWGEEYLQLNLDFIAESLCLNVIKPKKSESSVETIRRYLSTQFYKDHLKTYKKRPIYWLFSSGKQKAFECLVYLHRYNESTLSRIRTEYVTPLLGKYDAFADQLKKQLEDATTSEATLLKKEQAALEKKQTELRAFDDHLKHYADMRIKLDLDEGVKVNYGKFGDLLVDVKAVTGSKENS